VNRPLDSADSLVERLSHGHERHAQRWHLHVPGEGESAAQVRPLLVLLGLPTFGLALAISLVTTYGPVILIHLLGSPTAVGALIGGEGAFALVVPLGAGSLSDRLPPSPLGRRMPFVLVGAPLAAVGLVLLPFSSSADLAGAAVLAFFVGYYVYLAAPSLCARTGRTGDRPRCRARCRAARRRPPAGPVAAAPVPDRNRRAHGDDARPAAGLPAAGALRQRDAPLRTGVRSPAPSS
jgi:hypothetical protein